MVVTYPVLVTSPRTSPPFVPLVYIILVPLKSVYFFIKSKFCGSYVVLFGKRAFFITGTDSPVSMLSFTIQDPDRSTISHGIKEHLGTIATSPGTRLLLLVSNVYY